MSKNQIISLIEKYIFEADKETFFKSLVHNSETYLYLRLSDHLNRYGLEMPEDSKMELEYFLANFDNQRSHKIQFKHLLLQIEKETDLAKRKALIQEFSNKFLNLGFSFLKPYMAAQSNIKDQSHADLKSELDVAQLKPRWLENRISKFENVPNQTTVTLVPVSAYHMIDLEKLLSNSQEFFYKIIEDSTFFFENVKNIHELLYKFQLERKKEIKSYFLESKILEKLLPEQLKALYEILPQEQQSSQIISVMFKKHFLIEDTKFPCDIENIKEFELTLLKMKNWMNETTKNFSQAFQDEFKPFIAQINRALLSLGIRTQTSDKDLLVEFLNYPTTLNMPFLPQQIQKIKKANWTNKDYSNLHQIPKSALDLEQSLLTYHVERICARMDEVVEFDDIFPAGEISKWYYKAKLLQGENFSNITDIFSEQELNEIKETKKLKFLKTNKAVFARGEDIKLEVEIKNVQELVLKIFEIDAFNYYQNKKKIIDKKIKLIGLEPILKKNFTYLQNSIISHKEIFEISDLKEKKGLFIIEFLGGGLSSRAVLYIGQLNHFMKTETKGYSVYIVDEKENILTRPEAGLYYNGKKYFVEENTGKILVPFEDVDIKETKGILFDSNLSKWTNLNFQKQNYKFLMSLLLNEEQADSGNKLELLLQPKLLLNDALLAPLTLIHNAQVVIESESASGIKSRKEFTELDLGYDRAMALDYVVPSQSTNLTVTFKGEIFEKNSEKKDKKSIFVINSTKKIKLQGYGNNLYLKDIFLHRTDRGFVLKTLGKNGEALPDQIVQIDLKEDQAFGGYIETISDKNGEILLGDLSRYKKLRARFNNPPASVLPKNWILPSSHLPNLQNLPDQFSILQGEELALPLGAAELTQKIIVC